jgi:hypothetical protein
LGTINRELRQVRELPLQMQLMSLPLLSLQLA